MKRTTNYALPTWEKSDFIQMSDFNDLTQKTDAALKANADAAAASAKAAKASETNAKGSETAASGSASQSAQSAGAASGSASQAAQSAGAAAASAESAQSNAAQALAAKNAAEASATLSQSWTEGGTGIREGENTNNAKYWAGVAQGAAGGGVTTFNGRSGAVVPAEGDYTAEMVGARPESWIPSAADTGAVPITEKGAPNGVATLGPDGKVPAGQLPKMDYDPAGSAEAVQKALTAHTGNKNNPHAVTAEQVGALASSGGVMSGAISMSGHKIANLAAPADSTDAANKQYVDEHAGAKVILGSYVGTGKSGKSNPNQITLAEPFKLLCIYGIQHTDSYTSISDSDICNIIPSSIIPTEYTSGFGFGMGYNYNPRDTYGKKSTDGKTFSWYFGLSPTSAADVQFNTSGVVYHYYAIV